MTDLISAAVDQAPAIAGTLFAITIICVLGGRALMKRRG